MTEVRDNSDAEWEEKIVKEVEERRAKRSKTRSQDLDRILLLKRRQLDEDVNLACAGHQARYDSDVREHLQKLKLQAYKAKESTPDLKARIDQETTLLHQQVPRAQEMMDLMDHLRAQVGLPKAEFEAPQSHDLLGLQEAEQARASTDQARPSTDQGRASTDQAQDTTMEPPPNPREPAQDGDGRAMARAMARATAATAKARVGTNEATRAATNTTTNTDRGPTTMLALPQEPIKPKATSQADNLAGSRHGFRRGSSPQASKPTLNPKLQLQLQDPPFVISPFRWRLQGGRRRAVHPQLRLGLLRQVPDMSLVFYWNRFYCVRQNPF